MKTPLPKSFLIKLQTGDLVYRTPAKGEIRMSNRDLACMDICEIINKRDFQGKTRNSLKLLQNIEAF